jgi:hypothetical protein
VDNDPKEPEFPIRIIFDDGQCDVIDSPQQLLDIHLSVDSRESGNGVWVRDALDRSVHLRCEMGQIVVFAIAP